MASRCASLVLDSSDIILISSYQRTTSIRYHDEQELQAQLKFSPALEAACKNWIGAVLGKEMTPEPLITQLKARALSFSPSPPSFSLSLSLSLPSLPAPPSNATQDGVLLCRALNILQPGSVAANLIYEGKMAFKQLENLHYYLKGVTAYGVGSSDLFDTSDLFEEKNVNMVLTHINALAKLAETKPGYTGTGPPPPFVSFSSS